MQYVHVIEKVELLEAHADPGTIRIDIFRVKNILTEYADGTAVRSLEQINTAKKRRFSGAGAADQADNFLFIHIEIDALQNLQIPKTFVDVADLHDRLACSDFIGLNFIFLNYTALKFTVFRHVIHLSFQPLCAGSGQRWPDPCHSSEVSEKRNGSFFSQ